MKRRSLLAQLVVGASLAGCLSNSPLNPEKELFVENETGQNLTAEVKLISNGETILEKTYDLEPGKSDSTATFSKVPDSIIVTWNGNSEELPYSPPPNCKRVTGINLSIPLNSIPYFSTDCYT